METATAPANGTATGSVTAIVRCCLVGTASVTAIVRSCLMQTATTNVTASVRSCLMQTANGTHSFWEAYCLEFFSFDLWVKSKKKKNIASSLIQENLSFFVLISV